MCLNIQQSQTNSKSYVRWIRGVPDVMWLYWALAQNTHRVHFGPWLPPWHSWCALPETSWLRFRTVGCYNLQCFYYTYNVFSTYTNSDLIMEIRILVFSYHHSSSCMNQITVNLHCIELECLLLNIAIRVSYFKMKKPQNKNQTS